MDYFAGDRVQHPTAGTGTVTTASTLAHDVGQHVEVALDDGGGWRGHSMFLDHATVAIEDRRSELIRRQQAARHAVEASSTGGTASEHRATWAHYNAITDVLVAVDARAQREPGCVLAPDEISAQDAEVEQLRTAALEQRDVEIDAEDRAHFALLDQREVEL